MKKLQSAGSPAACAANQGRIVPLNDLEPSVSGVQSPHMLITPLLSNRNHFRWATCIKPFFFYKLKRSVLVATKSDLFFGMGKRPRVLTVQTVRMCP